MTKFVIRRIFQAIPTIIGITIIAYFIMDLAPGNPLSQLTLDPNLDAEQRSAILEANGVNDPVVIKYFRWLIGDAPIAFNENPAWAVQMNDGQTVIVDASTGDVLETRPTNDLATSVADDPIRPGRAGEREFDSRAAAQIALEVNPVEVTEVVDLQWVPRLGEIPVWAFNLESGNTVVVNATAGEVVEITSTEDLLENPLYNPQDAEQAASPETSREVARELAVEAAREAISADTQSQWIREYQDSSAWVISLNNGNSVLIDSASGEVLLIEETSVVRSEYRPGSSDFGSNEEFPLEEARALAVTVSRNEITVGDSAWVPDFPLASAWVAELNNGETLVINSNTGEVVERVPTGEFNREQYTFVEADAVEVDLEVNAREAGGIAEDEVPTTDPGWLPYYDATVLWEGRQLPVFRSGEIIGEEVGEDEGVLRGDFGMSFVSKSPATEAIASRIGATFELGMISLIVGMAIGIPVGVLAAVYQGSIFDQITRIGAVLVSAIPVFWLGLILLLIFGSWLQVLPMGNRFPLSLSGEYTIAERIQHLILPVFTLSSFSIATFSRYMRASLLDVLGEDYVRTARSKGLSDRKVWFKHSLRNALIPMATILGPALTNVLAGAVLTETIYSWPGMGTLVVNSVLQQDYPVIMGIVLLTAFLTIVGYLISDILYAVFDPRVRLG